jgi:acetoin utilization deacetylase AcuC-like enzyme
MASRLYRQRASRCPASLRDVRAYYCDHFVFPLPEGHRFPMVKYRLLRERVAAAAIAELHVPKAATREELKRVHTADYVGRAHNGTLSGDEVRRIGFPFSAELVERSRRSVGGTISASRAALENGASVNMAGGTHHAFAGHGEGFCVFNDVAVAVRAHQATGAASRFAVLDLDVHQGNGTARIFTDDDAVFTLSVHGEKNFPFRKESSDLDLELPDGCEDERYLETADYGIRSALADAPDLAFYVAGADPYVHDRLGRLAVTKEGLAQRDRLVFEHCARAGVPVAVVMSGGYAAEVTDTVDIHEHTVRAAAQRTTSRSPA